MAHNFHKHLTDASGRPILFVSKAGPLAESDGLMPETAFTHPNNAAPVNSSAYNLYESPTGEGAYQDGGRTVIVGAGMYQGECLHGMPHRLIADGKVVWLVNGNLYLGTKFDNSSDYIVDGFTFRFIDKWFGTITGGGFVYAQTAPYKNCFFHFNSNAFPNTIDNPSGQNSNTYWANCKSCIFKNLNARWLMFENCLMFSSYVKDSVQFKNSYLSPDSTLELSDLSQYTVFSNNNIQGLIRVKDDLFGYTTLEQFKQNYGMQGRTDLISQDPKFNRPEADEYSLKIDSPHLNASIGPKNIRFGSAYYFEMVPGTQVGDAVTVNNCVLRSTANPLYSIAVVETNGLTWNGNGSMTINPNDQGLFEGFLLTDRIRVSELSQKLKRFGIISGLNFDTNYPGAQPAGALASANPPVFNNNVPDYTNYVSGDAGRNPNRLTEQMRWSSNENPSILTGTYWETGNEFLEFELETDLGYNVEPFRGTGQPTYDPTPAIVQPVLARWIQLKIKTRNDYYSR